MKPFVAAIAASASVNAQMSANDAWTDVAAAYTDLYDAVHDAYVGTGKKQAVKKANRVGDFYNKVNNFPGRVSASCAEFAGSGDPAAFVPPYYDSEDICHSINNFIASVTSYHDAYVCMDDVDLTANNGWAPHKMIRTIQRQRNMLFNRKLKQLQCSLPIAPTPPPCDSNPCDGLSNCYTLIDGCAIAPVRDTSLGPVPAAISYKISAEVFCDHSGTESQFQNILFLGADVWEDGVGDRLFVLSKGSGWQKIHFVINKGDNAGFVTYHDFACVDGEWNTYALEVQNSPFSSSDVDFTATVDGNVVMQGSYPLTGEGFGDLQVYSSNPLHTAAPHKVRNFFYQTL
ncbi:Oidioi.mRNA.OKI2018_I69.chr2.g5799.t1.cds [Oikopleura dioica]|uniref:Oidioi.mRNA.OKI2018_I69.chr2.g5799.t1.cds n=1 Tax=Oikopleura dioica TaxID=34765 RepID=A0ABN7T734_OIKDI|nr:Oidioi.mRNA.OKI2018_I69.chr2.g5799.t1.cds [Oikopleura dioica]